MYNMINSTSIIVGIIIALVILMMLQRNEGFENKNDKASAINKWWQKTKSPSYADYKADVKNSDIIEYKRVKDMMSSKGDVSVKDISNVIT